MQKIDEFGKIPYHADDIIMEENLCYDPEQDRDLHSFNYGEGIKISDVRSLKRKIRTKEIPVKTKLSSATKPDIPTTKNQGSVDPTTVPLSKTTSSSSKKYTANLLKKTLPFILPANPTLQLLETSALQDPNLKSLHVSHTADGKCTYAWKVQDNTQTTNDNATASIASSPSSSSVSLLHVQSNIAQDRNAAVYNLLQVNPVGLPVTLPQSQSKGERENIKNVENCLSTVQNPVPSVKEPEDLKCIKVICQGKGSRNIQEHSPKTAGKQPVVLKRLKIVNPGKVNIGIHEILRHLETVGFKPGKTIIKTVSKLNVTEDIHNKSGDTGLTGNKVTKFVVRKLPVKSASTMMTTGKHVIRLKPMDENVPIPATSRAVLEAMQRRGMKKRADSKLLKAALMMARKPTRPPPPPRPPSPEFEPGTENMSFLYLKVEDPYPDEHGNVIEPSLSLIERSLNQTSWKAEDTTTWTTKHLGALGAKGADMKAAKNTEESNKNKEPNEPVPKRAPSPDLEDHSYYNRPPTPESIRGESEGSVNEAEEENCPEGDELEKVYTEACRYQIRRPKKSLSLPLPADPENTASMMQYLQKKVELVNEDNRDLGRELRRAQRMISRLRERIFQFKLARGFKAGKKKKTQLAPSSVIVEKSTDDFWG